MTEQYEWRKIKDFEGYELSNGADVRNAKTKQVLTRTKDNKVILMVEGKRYKRGVWKLFKETFPEYVPDKKPKVLEYEGDKEISKELDTEYKALESLATKVVNTGHMHFRATNKLLEPIWTRKAIFNSGKTVVGSYQAEDLVQEAIMAGYAALSELDVDSARPTSYVAKTMRNKLYNLVNRLDPYELSLNYIDENGEVADLLDTIGGTNPDDDELSIKDRQKINELRQLLEPEEYELLYDYHGLEYTMPELSKKYKVSRETIGKRISRIIDKLK